MAKLTRAAANRRIEFLINEAKSADPTKDVAVDYAFRTITNFHAGLEAGPDVRTDTSELLRKNSCLRSRRAHELIEAMGDWMKWKDAVTPEHQYPIKRAWEWMLENKHLLTAETVDNQLRKWPVVVITKEENGRLKDSGANPEQRYKNAGIEVWRKNKGGNWKQREL